VQAREARFRSEEKVMEPTLGIEGENHRSGGGLGGSLEPAAHEEGAKLVHHPPEFGIGEGHAGTL